MRNQLSEREPSTVQNLAKVYLNQTAGLFGENLYIDKSIFQIENEWSSLAEFESAICNCQKCPLSQNRTKFVFGVGNSNADLLFVGEGPGQEEDLKGKPFVGRAGHLLDKILAAIQMTRNEVYICNMVKCRPPENRNPQQEEIDACFHYLETQIQMVNPKLIVALGRIAAHALLDVKTPIGQLRSKMWKWRQYDLVVTYHPAALLRNPGFKPPAWEDFKWIRKMITGNKNV